MLKRLLFISFMLFLSCRLFAQVGWPDMRVIFRQYNQHKQDTTGVQVLLKLARMYRNISDPRSLRDSALLMARQAETLSRHINYTRGVQQSLYFISQFSRDTKDLNLVRPLLSQLDDTTRIKLMLDIAADQLNTASAGNHGLDTSLRYIKEAIALSDAIHYLPGKVNGLLQLAKYYEYTDELRKGSSLVTQAFSVSQKAGYIAGEASCYTQITDFLAGDSSLYPLKDMFWEQMIGSYKKLTGHETILAAQASIAAASNYADLRLGARNEGSRVIEEQLKGIEFAKTCTVPDMGPYWSIICAYLAKEDLNKALTYSLEAVRVTERNENKQLDERAYFLLGVTYYHMNKNDAALENLHKTIDILKQKDYVPGIQLLLFLAKTNQRLHMQDNSLPFILEYIAHTPVFEDRQKVSTYRQLAMIFLEMGKPDLAEKYALASLELANQFKTGGIRDEVYIILASIYYSTKRYDKAGYYGLEVLKDVSQTTASVRRRAHLQLFSIDTATHNYADAVQHLLAYNVLNDSTYDITKNKQLEELKVQYETEKKEKDIELLTRKNQLQTFTSNQQELENEFEQEKKQRSIEQMAFQAERKDKDLSFKEANIHLLLKQRQLQDAALVQARWLRNGLIAGAFMLVLLLALLYNRFRVKQKNNRLLEMQQQKINQSNIELQQLNGRQQKLLTEKEWLIKEVHHRVKNNLQLVISLLNMQSHYLKDEFTLNAFSTIGRRIQAISLIHQKLYQVEDVTKINMRDYVRELLHYLEDSTSGTTRIRYEVTVEPILLDPAISVPLGLILNEAVTNAIKHAFTQQENGTITIRMTEDAQQNITLLIADNGKGITTRRTNDGMGFTLMETLCKQIDASLKTSNDRGLQLLIQFCPAEDLTDASVDMMALK